MSKSKILNVRIDPDLKKKARRVAEQDGRTLSNWVTRLIERAVDEAAASTPQILAEARQKKGQKIKDKGKGKT